MKRIDERTPEDFAAGTHTYLVVANDSFMSGWGEAEGGLSVCAWACSRAELRRVERWVNSRGDMKHVRIVHDPDGKYRPKPKSSAVKHYHVYRVDAEHLAMLEEP